MSQPNSKIRWLTVVANGLAELNRKAVAAGMPESDAVRIFSGALDEAAKVFLQMQNSR